MGCSPCRPAVDVLPACLTRDCKPTRLPCKPCGAPQSPEQFARDSKALLALLGDARPCRPWEEPQIPPSVRLTGWPLILNPVQLFHPLHQQKDQNHWRNLVAHPYNAEGIWSGNFNMDPLAPPCSKVPRWTQLVLGVRCLEKRLQR